MSPQNSPSLKFSLNLERMHLTYRDGGFSGGLALQRQPLIQTSSIQHWTSLVEDDVASHLLSFYFTWENPTWYLIDKELFFHDLETRATRFCSPLLVNVLLLFGCVSSNHSCIRNVRQTDSFTRASPMASILSSIDAKKRHLDKNSIMRFFGFGNWKRKRLTSRHYNRVSCLACYAVLLGPIDWAPN